jgi:hypothetical protein
MPPTWERNSSTAGRDKRMSRGILEEDMVVCFDDGAAIRVVAAADRRSIIGIGRERDETEQNFIVMKRQSSKDIFCKKIFLLR